MNQPIRLGIFAASSIVPHVEFQRGIDHLKRNGFDPIIHPQVSQHHFIFPGPDDLRAQAIFDFAHDPTIEILWAARGGYGAGRLLPILERLTQKHGAPPPGKLLIGYSDVTVLHEFVRNRWNWSTLHAPMPAASNFSSLDPREWNSILDYANRKPTTPPWVDKPLTWLTNQTESTLEADLIGGNLALWSSLAGTPWFPSGAGKFIFLEDTDEPFYRIDRMMTQLVQSGAFTGAKALILGDFTNCNDESNTCLASPDSTDRKPLRKTFTQPEAFTEIFTPIGRQLNVAIATGLVVGHGPHFAPLPLGARYLLNPEGKLQLIDWDWLSKSVSHA